MSIGGLYAKEYTSDGALRDVDISYLFKETNNIFSEIVKDRAGNLWIGTFSEGVQAINFDKPAIKNYLMSSIKEQTGIATSITAIYEDFDGDIWINQNRWGLGIFNPLNNSVRFYSDYPQLRGLPSLNIVRCISGFRSVPGEIWVGPENESVIFCMKKENGNIVIAKRIDLSAIASNTGYPRIFFEDRRNNIWIVTTAGLLIKPYNDDRIEPVSFALGTITGITEDTKGTIWVSSKNSGVFQIPISGISRIDRSQIQNFNSEQGFLPSDNIESVCADNNGKVWIGAKEGNIIVCNVTDQKFKDYSKAY
jgi:ligand-binding sensor domain-containing protein